MNYSDNKTYGRKVVKSSKLELYQKRLITSWVIFLMIGFVIGCFIGFVIAPEAKASEQEIEIQTTEPIEVSEVNAPVETTQIIEAEDEFIPLDIPLSEDLQEYIYELCCEKEIDYSLIVAMIEHESGFSPNVISNTNDYGLMQINKVNHKWLTEKIGVTNYLNPYENAAAGIYMLGDLFEKYENPALVLMAYNLGEAGASRLWEQGIFETTYSNKILQSADEYEQQISGKEGEING